MPLLGGATAATYMAALTVAFTPVQSGTRIVSPPDAGPVAASSSGALDLAGSGSATAAAASSGSLTLSGTATGTAGVTPASANGVLTLAGTATAFASTTAAGALTLSGTATGKATAASTGALTFAGTAAATASSAEAGGLTLTGSGTATVAASSTGSLTLTGAASSSARGTAPGALALSGAGTATASAAAAGSLALAATATASTGATAAGTLAATGTGTALGAATANGSLTLTGTATPGGQQAASASGGLTLSGTASATANATGTGNLTLRGRPQMPLPGGATGFTLTFGQYGDPAFVGMKGILRLPVTRVHTATGAVVQQSWTVTIAGDGTGSITDLPFTDDAAFTGTGQPFTLQWQALSYKDTPGNKTFQVLTTQGSTVDYDGIAGADGSTTAAVQFPLVTSVVGQSGAVTGTQIAADPALRAAFDAVFAMPAPSGSAATDAANLAALVTKALAVVDSGRALITFQSGVYQLNAGLPVYNGVSYRGVPPVLIQQNTGAGYMPDAEWFYAGGTILQGNHTGDAIHGNTTPAGSAVDGVVGLTQIAGVELYGFGIQGYVNGLNIGATNVVGLVFSSLDELYVRDCTGWGVRMINFQHVQIGTVRTAECTVGGQYWACEFPVATLTTGICTARELFHKGKNGTAGNMARGIVIAGLSTSTTLIGGFTVDWLQHNSYNRVAISQTATLTSGSSTVAVTDGTKFAVGMPVVFTADGQGFTGNTGYIVRTVSGNNLTLALTTTGTAITATGSGTLTIQTRGFANVEVIGNAGTQILNSDVEGNGTVAVWYERNESSEFHQTLTPGGFLIEVIGRNNVNSTWHSVSGQAKTDFDSASAANCFWFGARDVNYGFLMSGMYVDQTGQKGLAISGGFRGNPHPDIETRANAFLYPGLSGMGQQVTSINNNLTLDGNSVGTIITINPVTYTLATVVSAVSNPVNSLVGAWWEIHNIGAGTITVNTDGTQVFNRVPGKTSVTIAAGHSLKIVAVEDDAQFFTAVLGTLA